MRIGVADHYGKAIYLAHKLAERFDLSDDVRRLDYELLLVDSDSPFAAPAPDKHNLVKECIRRGIPVVLYPHGAQVDLERDGMRKFAVPISLQLLHGEGHVEVYRRCGLGYQFASVGWTYSPVRKHKPAKKVESILFAPIHPWANGRDILPGHATLNRLAYQEFLNHPAERKIVRMYGEDYPNGITERVDSVIYTQSDFLTPWPLMAEVDAVISYGTLAHCALALGKPTVFIYGYPSHTLDDGSGKPAHFEEYADYVRYPASMGDAPLDELFKRDVSEWVDLFVGGPLDLDKLEGLLRGLRPNRATRRRLERAAA